MKPKLVNCLVLCVAVVLSGGLSGCSTAPSAASNNFPEGKLFSHQEAVDLESGNASEPWQLKYAVTGGAGELFVTVQQRGQISVASIYTQVGDKLKLLKRLTTDDRGSRFLIPNIFTATPRGGDWQTLVQITELFDGTGGLTEEHVFVVANHGTVNGIPSVLRLEEVEFIPAWESFTEHFGKNEGLWKGAESKLTDDSLLFGFIVWKHEDRNQSVVGKVTGTYKLERKSDGGWRMSMDTFKREPFTDEDWRSRGLRENPS